jgi:hypothetical protein
VQPPELRFWTALTAGRVLAAAGETAAALTSLESTVADARKGGVTAYELEARIALGEVELQAGRGQAGRGRLREAEAEARRLGLELLARQAAARR